MNSLVDSGTNALFPSLLAGFLDGASVLNARQVCKTWQDCHPLKNTKDNDDQSVREGYPRIVVNLFRRANRPICNIPVVKASEIPGFSIWFDAIPVQRMVKSVIRVEDRSKNYIAIALYVRGLASILGGCGLSRSKAKATMIVLYKRAEASSFYSIREDCFLEASGPRFATSSQGSLRVPNRAIATMLTWPLQTFEEGEIPDPPESRALYQRVLDVFRYLRCSQVDEADVIDPT